MKSVKPIDEDSDDNHDALAAKVELLLGRTRRESVDEDFDVESLGLLRVINDNDESSDNISHYIIEAQRSEPDGNGKPYQTIQTNTQMSTHPKKLVHYSSESEDNEEADSVKDIHNPSSSASSPKSISINTLNMSETAVRHRSYSASGSTGIKHSRQQTNTDFSISTFLRDKIQRKQISQKDSAAAGTQTLRSFLAEQALQQKHEDSSSHNESSGLLRHIHQRDPNDSNESSDKTTTDLIIVAQRSEPDGNVKPYQTIQPNTQLSTNFKKLVHYSSESEDNQEEERVQQILNPSSSTSSQKSISINTLNMSKTHVRHISSSSSWSSIIKHSEQQNTEISSNESATVEVQSHHERQFRHLVERQKNYLKCLQRELVRLEKMEKLFAKLHTSKIKPQTKTQSKPQTKPQIQTKTQTKPQIQTKTQTKTQTKPQIQTKTQTKIQTKPQIQIQTQTKPQIEIQTQSKLNNRFELSILENSEKLPICWFIPINKNKSSSRISKNMTQYPSSKSELLFRDHIKQTSTPLSLQEAFNRNCYKIRMESEFRINRINTIADMRKRTAEERLIRMTESYIKQKQRDKLMKIKCIQPVYKTTIKRVFTHEEMRAQTEKIYMNLPEVRALKERKKKEEKERNQRLMAQIYKYRLKDNALNGKITWKITQSCLTH